MTPLPALGLLAAALALATVPAQAQWKWRDANGVVQYSDRPPPASTPDRMILERPSGSAPAVVRAVDPAAPAASAAAPGLVPAAPKGVDNELEARRKKAEADEAARKKPDDAKAAAQRAENCQRARGQMRLLDEGVRMARINEKGEREFLDDQQRVEEARRTREVMASDCR